MTGAGEIVGQAIQAMTGQANKYLTFSLAGEEYGIGILKIREIIGMMPVTAVPQTAQCVKGVINLRGKVIPIIDLRLRFDMEEAKPTARTCFIIVETEYGSGRHISMGIVVDSVSEVLHIKAEDIEDSPAFGNSAVDTSFILGMAKANGRVKILLDIDRILRPGENQSVAEIAN